MNCYHCGDELIWGGDENCDDSDEYILQTNLTCSNCKSLHIVYIHKLEEKGTKE